MEPREPSAAVPFPSLELIDRVCHIPEQERARQVYDFQGAVTRESILDLLPDGWSFEGRSVLDFGCGAGRTLRHFLAEAEGARFLGADIDEPSIEWLRRNLSPPVEAILATEEPPLPIQDRSIDLVWAISVFTHLPESWSAWLAELHRILKPGGLLIASYLGRWTSEQLAGEPWDEDRVGRNVLHVGHGWDEGGPTALQSDWWTREHWGRGFEVVRIEERVLDQSWALLEKGDVPLSAEDLERLSDDPREVAALRHNLAQVQAELREAGEAQRRLRRDLGELAGAYESSLSWRLTRPLRALGRAGRRRGSG